MTILVDHEIVERLKLPHSLASGVRFDNHTRSEAQIQAASLDLTIGEIFVPGTDDGQLGCATNSLSEIALAQGHTAVIRTKESLNLGPHLAGIAFPPANVSLKGLLMTNPGHIDPGYKGPLHLTVINMGRATYSLRANDRIMRVLFIKLDGTPDAPYDTRFPNSTPRIKPELLSRLSADFLDVENRSRYIAEQIAGTAVEKAQSGATKISGGLTLLGTLIVAGITYWGTNSDTLHKFGDRLTVVEAKVDADKFDARVNKLEDEIAALKNEKSPK